MIVSLFPPVASFGERPFGLLVQRAGEVPVAGTAACRSLHEIELPPDVDETEGAEDAGHERHEDEERRRGSGT